MLRAETTLRHRKIWCHRYKRDACIPPERYFEQVSNLSILSETICAWNFRYSENINGITHLWIDTISFHLWKYYFYSFEICIDFTVKVYDKRHSLHSYLTTNEIRLTMIRILWLSYVMRKYVFVIWEQWRRKSACASAQSDQHLYCSLSGKCNYITCFIENFKTLVSLCSWAGRFESTGRKPRRQVFAWRGLCVLGPLILFIIWHRCYSVDNVMS